MKLSLYYPVKPFYVTQKFGETAFLDYYKNNGITFTGHNGIDMVAHHGEPIRASHDGYAYYEIDSKQGHGVVLYSKNMYELLDGTKSYIKTIYWHMVDPAKEPQYASPIIDKNGIEVKTGDVIGYANSSGLSTGDHLHFGLKPVALGEPKHTWYNVLQDNGYQGAIDANPYFNGIFAEDANNFVFNKDIELGDKNEDVRQLQKKLKNLGYFTGIFMTDYYGEKTREAVFKFQLEHVKMGWWARNVFRGMYCHKLTREVLNKL